MIENYMAVCTHFLGRLYKMFVPCVQISFEVEYCVVFSNII